MRLAINGAPDLPLRSTSAARRARRWAVLLVGLGVLLAVSAGCGRVQRGTPPPDGFTVTLATEPASPVVGSGTLIITILDEAGQPVNGAQLEVEGNMRHAGMKPVFSRSEGGSGGRYVVPMQWTMRGDWYVIVKATLPDGRVITREFPAAVR